MFCITEFIPFCIEHSLFFHRILISSTLFSTVLETKKGENHQREENSKQMERENSNQSRTFLSSERNNKKNFEEKRRI